MISLSLGQLRFLYFLIFLSGSSGLIYQVVWHKYLAILLGAHARATAIVLAIFLGGISLGYAVFGRWTRQRKWNLIIVYAFVELGLGFWAFTFPHIFRFSFWLAPILYSWVGVNSLIIDFFLSILALGIPTFLMGGTLPLLTQGLSRDVDSASGIHAKIYGFNTVGACLGCLLAGYVLIPLTGLPITLLIAGSVNVFISVISYFGYAKKWVHRPPPTTRSEETSSKQFTLNQSFILGIGFLSGFYILTLETILMRLMGLSTGSSNYNFTLIVAIFVFGLGMGSLLARHISKYSIKSLFWNQVMAAFTLWLLYLTADQWSYWVHVTRVTLRDIPQNFYFFQALLALVFTGVIILPVGYCGFTLPLCFHLLKDKEFNLGERVGQLYAINTIGCVLGALIGGHVLLYFLNLDHLFKVCIYLCLASALLSAWLYFHQPRASELGFRLGAVLMLVTLLGVTFSPLFHKERFIQPFRNTQPLASSFEGAASFEAYLSRNSRYLYYKDGPNTSVGIGTTNYDGKEVSRTIFVNGKSDGNTRGDAFTTLVLGHLPALLARKLDRSCVIGFGTGMTIGVLASYAETKEINVVEISDTIIKNRAYFDPYNGEVSKQPKVTIHEMDAFRYLEGTQNKFDIIVSEPSNPWVSGIENLYSQEFYKIAKKKLNPEGLFIQWIHTYSFNDGLFRMVLKTMGQHFPFVSVFQLKGGDLALLGLVEPMTREDLDRAWHRLESDAAAKKSLREVGVDRLETLLALELITPEVSWVMSTGAKDHSLESPKLSNEAARAFFEGNSAKVHALRRSYSEFYTSSGKSLLAILRPEEGLPWDVVMSFKNTFCDNASSKNATLCAETLALARTLRAEYEPGTGYEEYVPGREVASLRSFAPVKGAVFSIEQLQKSYEMFELFKKYYSPLARIPMIQLTKQLEFCVKNTSKAVPLYGECLLQKILVAETVRIEGENYKAMMDEYYRWFGGLAESFPNFNRFKEAKGILDKLAAEKKQ